MNFIKTVTGLGSERSKFKQICTPQERWKKHLNIVKGNPDHISIVVQKSESSKLNFKKPYLLFGLEKNCTIHQLRQNICKLLDLSEKDTLVLSCNRDKESITFYRAGWLHLFLYKRYGEFWVSCLRYSKSDL